MADGSQSRGFGAPCFGTPVHKVPRRGGRRGRTHDCGRHGQLTARQIADMAGISLDAVRVRLKLGWRGEQLCLTHAEVRRVGHQRKDCSKPLMVTAMRLALAFPDRMPTIDEIKAARPMEYRAAVRWRSVIRAARTSMGLPL